jgi:hypothetical protein
MMMIPVHVIAFFLATLLLPAEVSQFTINVQGKTIQWTKQDRAWHAVELPRDDWGVYSVKGKVVTVTGEGRERKTDVKRFLSFPDTLDAGTLVEIPTAKDSFGSPVTVKREKNKITLSQTKGVFFKTPATITWSTLKTGNSRTKPSTATE